MIKAVIFDMDGVLSNSEPLICEASIEMFKEKGVIVKEEDFLPFVGAGNNRYIGGVAEKYGINLDIEAAKTWGFSRRNASFLRMLSMVFRQQKLLICAVSQ